MFGYADVGREAGGLYLEHVIDSVPTTMLPPLPEPESDHERSVHVGSCYDLLSEMFQSTSGFLSHGGGEVPQIIYHTTAIVDTAIPMLLAMESISEQEEIPLSWIVAATEHFSQLLLDLGEAEEESNRECV